ncbi:NDR1/HIN1-like protein 6 [Chenopodium quinoa]|uniref:Late embryogenesis abundant protein LEA-2 subgroup domain-containing protein n=1 Tax=Chenopodium quinoa TaxID=63459 RepID=A0A803L0W9_CHEQI|nr:NDR1/HIN1-like protein 6 [Chenopodium quinoa]
MSRYGDTNPHFWPDQPDFPAPQHIQPEPRQPWDGHLHHPDNVQQPDMIHVRPRQRQSSPHPPPPIARPPRSPPEHAHQLPSSLPQRHRPPSPQRQHPIPLSRPVEGPPLGSTQVRPKPHSQHPRPHHVSFEHGAPPPRENLVYPTPTRTKPLTWFGAVFCVILWLVIILGGLLVLIIYLVYHPRTPHFEISSASLNAAYLDMGYLLNSDITVLANFTNPNKKVNVDFNYVVLQLYFDKHLIANQYIEPFSAFNTESKLANVEFVSSQVRLPLSVTQQLIAQIQRNRISLEVDGIFHVRSNFGSLLRYSYWLYGHCQIELTGPPSGVMLTSHCRTKD